MCVPSLRRLPGALTPGPHTVGSSHSRVHTQSSHSRVLDQSGFLLPAFLAPQVPLITSEINTNLLMAVHKIPGQKRWFSISVLELSPSL